MNNFNNANNYVAVKPVDEVTVAFAAMSQKDIISKLMQLYLYDISEYRNENMNGDGVFGNTDLDNYWAFSNCYPYLISVTDKPAGFALLRETSRHVYEMSEFFILRALRQRGIGRFAATQLFKLFPGVWHLAEDERNVKAQKFWRNTVREFTAGNYQENRTHGSCRKFELDFSVTV